MITGIIKPRVEEIFELVVNNLNNSFPNIQNFQKSLLQVEHLIFMALVTLQNHILIVMLELVNL